MLPEPRRASGLVHHQVSGVFRMVLQRMHRHVWVVRHLRSNQQGGAAGESMGHGLARSHLHYHPLGLGLRLFRRSGALDRPCSPSILAPARGAVSTEAQATPQPR